MNAVRQLSIRQTISGLINLIRSQARQENEYERLCFAIIAQAISDYYGMYLQGSGPWTRQDAANFVLMRDNRLEHFCSQIGLEAEWVKEKVEVWNGDY